MNELESWRERALRLEASANRIMVGQERAVRLLLIATFARGHVLLEGDVGVGKTTLLQTLARGIGGAFERIEGTVDLMPSDLLYYTYLTGMVSHAWRPDRCSGTGPISPYSSSTRSTGPGLRSTR